MEKIIIHNRTDKPLTLILSYVIQVVQMGRISMMGKSYCLATRFPDRVLIYAEPNDKSDKFIAIQEQPGR